MAKSKFYELIKNARIEKDVENVYTQGINLYFPGVDVEHTFACDAVIDTKNQQGKLLKLIIEYKFDEDFQSKVMRAKVITQVLFYMKRFEQNGLILPNVAMVGDVNECFVFHTNDIIKYLDEDVDWSVAPSSAHIYNPELVMKIAEDESINPFVFVIDEHFSFKDVIDKIYDLSANIQRYVHVTEHNIATIFEYFTNRVITNKKKISANDIVAIFMGVITKNEDYYKHPNKKNTLVTPLGDFKINENGFDSFFSYFNRNYTPQEKMRFTEISDRLIEDTNRRNKGEFYTPTLFVDYAHDMISKEFGEDWKEKYVVWDNSAGSKNLTRDYYFNELYSSTLEQAELDISKHYNKEAVSFQFDFLNDPLTKLPNGLIEAFEQNKPIIFFMNPPYASASNLKGGERGKGKGATATMISEEMVANKLGNASNNLYAQFIYRIMMLKHKYNLTNCHIALFCKPLYLSGSAFKSFRDVFLKDFKYNNGILFQASEFADVSANWGINFTIWRCGETDNKNVFKHTLVNNIDGEIVGDKTIEIYNLDNLADGKSWIKEPIKGVKVVEKPTLSSGLTVKVGPNTKTKIAEDSLGCYYNVANDVLHNSTFVTLYSSADSSNANGLSILPQNFERVMAMFASRKLIECVWHNADKQYLAPNTEHENYQEFVNDSIVYSLFSAFSQQSSLRNIDYKGSKWDIKNEFFWLSKEEMLNMSNECNNDYCYNDARTSNERYVYKLLQGITLSEEAQALLDKASEIVRKTFRYRPLFNEEHPEYQICNFDCGWYQIKALAKEYAKDNLEQFKTIYKKLADKMLPMVYELGFLRK